MVCLNVLPNTIHTQFREWCWFSKAENYWLMTNNEIEKFRLNSNLKLLWKFDFVTQIHCYFIFIFTLFYFTILYWFCHISTWIQHGCTCVPNPEPPSQLPPHNISLGHSSAPAPSILHPASNLDWWFISWYYTCFNAILPNHPILSLSHRVQKTVETGAYSFFTSLSFASILFF